MKSIPEIVVAGFFILAIVWKLTGLPGGGPLLILCAGTWSVFYFPLGFFFLSGNQRRSKNLSFSIAVGLFLSILPVAFLFKIQHWPMATELLIAGVVICAVVFALSLLNLKKGKPSATYFKRHAIRAGALGAIAGLLLVCPI